MSHNHRIERIREAARAKVAKLTPAQVQEIRSLYQTGKYSQSELGRKYGVSPTQARNIVLNRQWRGPLVKADITATF